ncbi:putative F-box/LRR-repeat protein 23 [Vicia villosa]|uniref:putative F-box/LRR-repeat protein 23 n=1 Tax=Vicia villosa TaxID=3911 RepID=UPI00273A787B|nr:putative F-box/LRR-repeat protein 23 [Vicia villosa]
MTSAKLFPVDGGSNNKPPCFFDESYDFWKIRMRMYLEAQGKEIWDVVENGPFIVRRAVDLSRGHLEDIAIELFCTDDLLKYIAQRASNLRRLKIPECNKISNEGLIEFVKMFSLLEELHISFKHLSNDSIEVIGRFCLLLKSLNLEVSIYYTYFDFHDELFAIGKAMPGLRHISFFRIVFDNDQLFAILDGCPLIKSLDLQNCFVRHLSPSVEKRCREKIKDFQLPIYNNYEDDYYDDDDDIIGGFAYMFIENYEDYDWEGRYNYVAANRLRDGFRDLAKCLVTGCTCCSMSLSTHYTVKFDPF